jgi:hypothetical protein
MLSSDEDLLIRNIKGLRYEYVPQAGHWRSISQRKNRVNKIITVSRLKVDGNTINARVQQYYAAPMSNSDSALSLEDTKNISFNDNGFAEKLSELSKND